MGGQSRDVALRPSMSKSGNGLSPEQLKAEVLACCKTATCVRREVRFAKPEDARFYKFLKHADIESGYMDFSNATEEEEKQYHDHAREFASRLPDEVWYFVVPSDQADEINSLAFIDAQSSCLGWSSLGEDEAWECAWGRLKSQEESQRAATYFVVLLGVVAIGLFMLLVLRH